MPRPWMPLYVADYLGDTGHLSTIEHGAYLLLIMHYWQNGSLPKEDIKLARITRTTTREWGAMRDTLADFFADGWSHSRIERELCSAEEAYQRRAKAGAKGGIAGAMLRKNPSNARARLKQSQSHPQKEIDPSREQGVQDVAGAGLSSADTAWDPDAPFGHDASDAGVR